MLWRRRRVTGRQTLGRTDIVGHPGVPEFNRQRRDVAVSARGRVIWWTVVGLIVLGFIALIVLTR